MLPAPDELPDESNSLEELSDSDLERGKSTFGIYLDGLYFSYKSAPDVATERANDEDDCLFVVEVLLVEEVLL